MSGYLVKRRYKEFDKLHQILSLKFAKYKKPLPELPPKRMFKKKENETRQYKLENYLMLLMDYPDILDSIAFRKFLQLNPLRFNEFKVEYKSYLSSSAAIYDSRLMLEEGSSPIDGTKVAQMDPSKPRSEVTLEPGVNYVSDTFKENETM